jgi:hypothetical protein
MWGKPLQSEGSPYIPAKTGFISDRSGKSQIPVISGPGTARDPVRGGITLQKGCNSAIQRADRDAGGPGVMPIDHIVLLARSLTAIFAPR